MKILYHVRDIQSLGEMWSTVRSHEIIAKGKLISIDENVFYNSDNLFLDNVPTNEVSMIDNQYTDQLQLYRLMDIDFDIDNFITKYQKFLDKINRIKNEIFINPDLKIKVESTITTLRYEIVQKFFIFYFDNFKFRICNSSAFSEPSAKVFILSSKEEKNETGEIDVNNSVYLEMKSLYQELLEIKKLFQRLIGSIITTIIMSPF